MKLEIFMNITLIIACSRPKKARKSCKLWYKERYNRKLIRNNYNAKVIIAEKIEFDQA